MVPTSIITRARHAIGALPSVSPLHPRMAFKLENRIVLLFCCLLTQWTPSITTLGQHLQKTTHEVEGLFLMEEYGCFACHEAGPASGSPIPLGDWMPSLKGAHQRLKPEYLLNVILSPDKPSGSSKSSHMPHMLAGLPLDEQRSIAEALTAYLWWEQNPPHMEKANPAKESSMRQGELLFQSLGCVACHPLSETTNPRPASLAHLPDKYQSRGLVAFLLDPQTSRPDFRMPDLQLSQNEAEHLAAYLMQGEVSSTETMPNRDLWETGKQAFGRYQCGRCHAQVQDSSSSMTTPKLPFPSQVSEGCLADKPSTHLPHYHFNPSTQRAFQSLITEQKETPSRRTLSVNAVLNYLQCHQCHARDGVGEPSSASMGYFTSSGEDLGDEGRLPPHLNGVGRKLQPNALETTLLGQGAVRPYLNTRMPNWGPHWAAYLATALSREDAVPNEQPTPRDGRENAVGRNMWGRALMGINGLGCIQCHALGGHPSLGIQAMDLRHATTRLRPEWFRDYLIDPVSFRPGTRMPAFWPDGKPSLPGNGGSTERQIDSLWAYLSEWDQSRLPEGMEAEDSFTLQPEKSPVVFRTFMKNAGLHAINVGFPQGYHAAFDAQQCRWIMAWQGDFLNAAATWDDRFTPLTEPEGRALPWFPLDFQASPALEAKLKSQETSNPHFLGYQKDEHGIPTFHYLMHGWRVEDRLEATSHGFLHTLQISSEPNTPPVTCTMRGNFTAIGAHQYQEPSNTRITLLKGSASLGDTENPKHLTLFMDPNENAMQWQYLIEQTRP